MNKERIFKKVVGILEDQYGSQQVTLESELEEKGLALDSLDITELNMECEKEFDLPNDCLDKDQENWKTVGDLVNSIHTHITK